MRILIFGTGAFYNNRKKTFLNDEIVAFIDNDSHKWGENLDGKKIIPIQAIDSIEYEYICLMAKPEFANQMKIQLKEYGISEDKIIKYSEYGMLRGDSALKIYYWVQKNTESKKKILLLSNELSYTGAPLVLFYLACILQKKGYGVTVFSPKDGELRSDYIKSGMMVAIQDNNIEYDPMLEQWFVQYDLVWGNTFAYSNWIEPFSKNKKPFVWWLHESEVAYSSAEPERIPKKIADNIHIYAVGNIAKENAIKYMPDAKIDNLLYGLPEILTIKQEEKKIKKSEKCIFALIGSICKRKAQDVFLDAIEKLSTEEKENSEFWIIGSPLEIKFNDEIEKKCEQMSQVKIFGALDRNEILEIYRRIDVLVCPSREDPMPVVAVEAMIMNKPSIVSDMTGTAALITDTENGFVCKVGNAVELAEKMSWIISNKDKLEEIGKNARKIYDYKFSMEVFENNVCRIIDEALR